MGIPREGGFPRAVHYSLLQLIHGMLARGTSYGDLDVAGRFTQSSLAQIHDKTAGAQPEAIVSLEKLNGKAV